MKRMIVLGLFVLTACGPSLAPAPKIARVETPASAWDPVLPDPAPAMTDGSGIYVCFNEYGSEITQEGPWCPDGWGGRDPEHPTPMGSDDF